MIPTTRKPRAGRVGIERPVQLDVNVATLNLNVKVGSLGNIHLDRDERGSSHMMIVAPQWQQPLKRRHAWSQPAPLPYR